MMTKPGGCPEALLDANLLLLLLLGDVDRKFVDHWERTRNFGLSAYIALDNVVRGFGPRLATTPNILTEVSNLANDLKGPRRALFFDRFAAVVPRLSEYYIESTRVSNHAHLKVFGITDLGILHLDRSEVVVLTADNALADYLSRQGYNVWSLDLIRKLS